MAREVTIDEIPGMVGEDLGSSEWHLVTQEDIQKFAEATGDHQWIHLDVERAKAESPYGQTIAHGYYTLSLMPMLMAQVWKISGARMGVNYGLNKLRFPAPVPVGKKVRAHAKLIECTEIEGGYQYVVGASIEVEDSEKPAAAVEAIYRTYK
jgi:acyl dehydratase